MAALAQTLEQAPSSAQVQALAYRLIDLHGLLLKKEVDAVLAAWDRLPPAQRQAIVRTLLDLAARTPSLLGPRPAPSAPRLAAPRAPVERATQEGDLIR